MNTTRSCPSETTIAAFVAGQLDAGLLRKGLDGKIVMLTDCDTKQCFVDACVPPGRCSPPTSASQWSTFELTIRALT